MSEIGDIMKDVGKLTDRGFSRRALIKGAGVGVIGLTLAQAGLFRALATTSETVQHMLDVTATVERFGVTFLGAAIQAIEAGKFNKPFPPLVLSVLKAARAQEHFHLQFFEHAGGRPFVETFTIPPKLLMDYNAFFGAIVYEEGAEVAAQIAAIHRYADLKRPDLVKISFQYAAEEAEHRLLGHAALGAVPANDRAFEPMLFGDAGDIIESLVQRGLIGGSGKPFTFPGPGTIDATNVIFRTPNGPAATLDCG